MDTVTPLEAPRSTALAVSGESAGASAYSPVDLGVLPGGYQSEAYRINALGDVVGYSNVPAGVTFLLHPVLWSHHVMRDLGLPSFGPGGGPATDINDGGTVVGIVGDWYGNSAGFVWKAGTFTQISASVPGAIVEPWGINNSEVVVGRFSVQTPRLDHAFRYTATGGLIDIHPAQAAYAQSGAVAISDRGAIAGWVTMANGGAVHAALWSPTGVFNDLGALGGGTYAGAQSINNSGVVVGQSDTSAAGQYAGQFPFLWRRGSGMIAGPKPGYASDISDLGRIVGAAYSSGIFAYTKKGSSPAIILPLAGTWLGASAHAVNRCGTIVGFAFVSNGFHAAQWDVTECD